jgi:hypothetical protein
MGYTSKLKKENTKYNSIALYSLEKKYIQMNCRNSENA